MACTIWGGGPWRYPTALSKASLPFDRGGPAKYTKMQALAPPQRRAALAGKRSHFLAAEWVIAVNGTVDHVRPAAVRVACPLQGLGRYRDLRS